jgi:hypothetical protein
MKFAILGLLIAFSQASGETNAPVALFARYEHPIPEPVNAALQAELDDIMEPTGFQFLWRELPKSTGREVHRELVVISFKGTCEFQEGFERAHGGGALGWTHTSGGDLLPFIDVECGRILSMVRSELRHASVEDRAGMAGRALGRVLAHELYHVLGRTKKHGSRGVAKAVYSSTELTTDELQLSEADVRRMWANRPDLNHEAVETVTGR